MPEAGNVDRVDLRHEPAHVAAEGVVEDRRAAIRHGEAVGRRVADVFANRHDQRVVDGLDRALRRRVEAADRLDRVADELDAQRVHVAGGEDVHDAAADAELAVLVHRVFRREPRLGEPRSQHVEREVLAGMQVDRRVGDAIRRAEPREQRRDRRDDDACVAARHRRAAPSRVPTPRRSGGAARGTDRLPLTGTARRHVRHPAS